MCDAILGFEASIPVIKNAESPTFSGFSGRLPRAASTRKWRLWWDHVANTDPRADICNLEGDEQAYLWADQLDRSEAD